MSPLGTTFRRQSLRTSQSIAGWRTAAAAAPASTSGRNRVRAAERRVRLHNGNKEGSGLRRGQPARESGFGDIFIRSLAAVGSSRRCMQSSQHTYKTASSSHGHNQVSRALHATRRQTRHFSTTHPHQSAAAVAEDVDTRNQISPREYKDLVNTYPSSSDLWEQPSHNLRKRPPAVPPRRDHVPLAPRLVVTPEQEDRPPYSARVILPPENAEHARQILHLDRSLHSAPGRRLERIWSRYERLPSPRPRYLSDGIIRKLFRHLAWVEVKDLESSQRYFSFLEECQAERVPITAAEWNTAISFAARWIKRVTSDEVKVAIETWMRMEKDGVQATNVTFNILFDAAARAGRFALANTIFNEMKMREMHLDRNFRTSMIFYAGLKRDGEAVRQAFRELVNAEEIVDTAIMNCVILSLVRADEAASAENVFAKMKNLHETKFGVKGPHDWRERKALGRELERTARLLRRDKEQHESSFFGGVFSTSDKKEEAQRSAPIHPDAHTCRILIKYHAYHSGNLDRCRELLAETRQGGWRVHGSVYVYLFRGFWVHGGHAYTAWNRKSLEEFWEEFLQASSSDEVVRATERAKADERVKSPSQPLYRPFKDETIPLNHGNDNIESDDDEDLDSPLSHEDTPPYFTAKLAERALYAFYKCAGRKKMLQIWSQIQERWTQMNVDERLHVEEHLRRLGGD